MPSITDDLVGQVPQGAEKTARVIRESATAAKGVAKTGICITWKGGTFCLKSIIHAIKFYCYKKSNDVTYSSRNISINKLQENGQLQKINEGLTKEVMQSFDQYAKNYGINYAALVDRTDAEPRYFLFFTAKDQALIDTALQSAERDMILGRQKPSIQTKLEDFRAKIQQEIKKKMQGKAVEETVWRQKGEKALEK